MKSMPCRLLPILIKLFSLLLFLLPASLFADFLDDVETQITPQSGSEKIIKLQKLFQELDLYNGEIDGKYSSIE